MKLFQSMLKVYWRKAGKNPPHKTDVTRDGNAAQHSEIPEAKAQSEMYVKGKQKEQLKKSQYQIG